MGGVKGESGVLAYAVKKTRLVGMPQPGFAAWPPRTAATSDLPTIFWQLWPMLGNSLPLSALYRQDYRIRARAGDGREGSG